MDKIVIHGNKQLAGNVEISGAKNAVLPLMAAALLADGITIIRRVPDLRDTRTMMRLLEMTGALVDLDSGTLKIDASTVDTLEAPYDLVKTMRASFYILGPLLGRFGTAKVSLPGGCAWGPRPVDFHLKAMEKLGAQVTLENGYTVAEASRLKGSKIRFNLPSVGATGNVLMAAVLAKGTTIISNAAMEPEITQLAEFLVSMGGMIEGIGTNELIVTGVDGLQPTDIEVIPDRIEAGTFLISGAALGSVTINKSNPEHLTTVIEKLEVAGANISIAGDEISVRKPDSVKPVNMTTEVYPGFPTDLQAQWIALMSIADGSSVIKDTIYHDRFSHVPELNRLGAKILNRDNVAKVAGNQKLRGARVMSTDIRASASLIIAGLIAKGTTEISRVYHIDRGYENIEEKYARLGAEIYRTME